MTRVESPQSVAAEIQSLRILEGVACVEYDEPLLCVQLVSGESITFEVTRGPSRCWSATFFADRHRGSLHDHPSLCDLVAHTVAKIVRNPSHCQEPNTPTSIPCTTSSLGFGGGFSEDMLMSSRQNSALWTEIDADIGILRNETTVTHVSPIRTVGNFIYITWMMMLNDQLTAWTAAAWDIQREEPLEVVLTTYTHYRDSIQPPVIEIFQNKKKFPFGQQMSRIVNEHLAQCWPRNFPTCSVDTLLVSDGESSRNAAFTDSHLLSDPTRLQQLVSDSSKTTQYDASKDPNKMVSFDVRRGLLCHVVDVIRKRSTSVSQYCVLCDQPHLFANNMLRPAVCAREMCVYQFQDLKLGSDSAESIATDAGVVDLLLTIFRCAALSWRAAKILNPFPSVANPHQHSRKTKRGKKKTLLALDPNKPNFTLLRKVVLSFPHTQDVVQWNDVATVKEKMKETEPLAYPLFEWVIASNRSHLIQMDQRCLIRAMDTPLQYLLLMASPEKEAIFREKKAKHGTKFAFHGSKAENWHSILRNGLKNMSGTDNQVNGAVHGSGIYVAPRCEHVFDYCNAWYRRCTDDTASNRTYRDHFISNKMIGIALCEIIDDGCIKEHDWCWTIEEEDNVMTRFFFVFNDGVPKSIAKLSGDQQKLLDEVNGAMKFYQLGESTPQSRVDVDE